LIAGVLDDYRSHTGREAAEDFPEWEPCHRALLGNGIVGFRERGRPDRRGHRNARHAGRLSVALARRRRVHRQLPDLYERFSPAGSAGEEGGASA
jgi:hypothetical protein